MEFFLQGFFLVQNKLSFKFFNILSVGGSDADVLWKRWYVYRRIIWLTRVVAGKADGHSGKTALAFFLFGF